MSIEHLVGQTIGQYHLTALLGTGGMGAVYRAHQPALERDVAIKVLPAALARQPDYVERFNHEAKVAASLEHRHIVPIYDYGTHNGFAYLVMRLLEGGTLSQRLYQRDIEAGYPPSLGEIAALLRQAAEGLQYAHRRNVIHMDVKPGNLMFEDEGSLYVVDFGIAKLLNRANATPDSHVYGTPEYMPPEQWRGENLTPATDQYALAVVIYRMLAGHLPFEGPDIEDFTQQHLFETPPSLPNDLPPELANIVLRALDKEPQNRFPTITDFADAFHAAIVGEEGQTTNFFTFPLAPFTEQTQPMQSQPPSPQTVQRPLAAPAPQPPVAMPAPRPNPQPRTSQTRSLGLPPILMGLGIGAALLLLVVCGGILLTSQFINPNRQDTAEDIPADSEVVTEPTQAETPSAAAITLVPAGDTTPLNSANAINLVEGQSFSHGVEPVRCVEFSPDGSTLATGAGDGVIRLWDGSGSVVGQMSAGGGVVYSIAYSPDGGLLAAGYEDGSVKLWDTNARVLLTTFTGHTGAVRSVAFHPDGSLIASAGEDLTARLWNVSTGTQIAMLRGHEDRVFSVAFNNDGSRLATAGEDGTVRLWDSASGVLLTTFGGGGSMRAVAFRPDGQQIAGGSADGTIYLWDTSGNEQDVLTGHSGEVWHLAYSPDGTLLASGGRDNTARLWLVATGSELTVLNGHGGWVLGVDFNAANTMLATASGDGTARLWDFSS